MASLSTVVMAHPTRADQVTQLLARLDQPVDVVWDTNPVPSADPLQRWATGRRAWETIDHTCDFGLVIQDDAIVCEDLIPGLATALDQIACHPDGRPLGLVSAYSGTGRPDQYNIQRAITHAETHRHAWHSTRSLNWGVAIIAPVWTIDAMLTWCSTPARASRPYDQRIGLYYRDMLRWRTWYTNPSLVDHHNEIPSLIGNDRGPVRLAHNYNPGSALTVDWTRTPPGGLVPTVHPAPRHHRHALRSTQSHQPPTP